VHFDDLNLCRIERAKEPRDAETTQREIRHSIECGRHHGAVPHTLFHNAFPERPIPQTKPATRLIRQGRVEAYDYRIMAREFADEVEDLSVSSCRKLMHEYR
jgi:hypothetical protein